MYDIKNKHIVVIILLIIILLQLGRIIYIFEFQREGYHSDEGWSYGFANSYYEPYIYMDSDNKLKNVYKWIPSQVAMDYLQVNKGEEFSYGSVYFNQENDLSPPLHSMILHTICSFFPETFSWWYAFSINIVAFILTQIALFFLGKALMKSNLAALVLCLLYGSISGAVNCFVYLRMYGLLTLLAVISAYLHVKVYNKNFLDVKNEFILIFLVTIAGSLTHYYFLVYSFFMAACICIYLIAKRHWKQMFIYACCMLLAVTAVFGIYPFALSHLKGGPSLYSNKLYYFTRIEYCIALILFEITGINLPFPNLYTLSVWLSWIIGIIAFGTPVCFLLRKETWFLKAVKNTVLYLINAERAIVRTFRSMELTVTFLLLTVVFTLAVIAYISNVLLMGIFTDRYLFFLIPILSAVLVAFIKSIVSVIPIKVEYGKSALLVLLVTVFLINNILNANCNYLFRKKSDGPDIDMAIKNANCIIVTGKPWRLTYYASRLLNTNSFFVMFDIDGLKPVENLKPQDSSIPLYMVIEDNRFLDEDGKVKQFKSTPFENADGLGLDYTEEQFVDYLKKSDWISDIKYISTESSFAGQLDLFRIYLE